MGTIKRFRDIVNSNINATLDKVEDPEKLIKSIIREMEETLIDLKVSRARVMAEKKKITRQIEDAAGHVAYWDDKAHLAAQKGRDDLAREALVYKRQYSNRAEGLEMAFREQEVLVGEYEEDMRELGDKLANARERQRVLVQRHIHANRKRKVHEEIRRVDSTETISRFSHLENRIASMEAEAGTANYWEVSPLVAEFNDMITDEEIERELNALKTL